MQHVGNSTLVAQTADSIFRVTLRTGRVERVVTPELVAFSSFVAGQRWIVAKTIDDNSGVVVDSTMKVEPLPPGLEHNGRVYLSRHDDMWLLPEDPADGARTAIRLDAGGRRVGKAAIRIPENLGYPTSDMAGDLMVTTTDAFYQATPHGIRRLGTGQLLGANDRQALSWDCDREARCDAFLLDRATKQRERLAYLHSSLVSAYRGGSLEDASTDSGALSPNGATLAVPVPSWDGNQARPLAVIDLTTGRTTVLPGSLTDVNGNAQFAWSSNSRYLFAITDHTIRALDTRTHQISSLSLTAEPILHLAIAGQPGN